LFLQYVARKIVVVGDDQQISPESVGLDRGSVDALRQRYIKDLPHWDALGVDNSFFDQAQIRFAGRIRLREHFRCMPEIIQFSNSLCYQGEPLVPLRQYGSHRLTPVLTRHLQDGYAKGTGDRVIYQPEAEAIAGLVSSAYARAIKWGLATTNPVTHSDLPKVRKRIGMALLPSEQDRLIQCATGPWCLPVFLGMAAATGARRGEVLALRWSDVKGMVVLIDRSLCHSIANFFWASG